MPRPFALPDLGEGLAEAEIVKVLVKEGDVIREDAPLLEVETDKAQVEIPSPLSGRVLKIHVQPHQTVRVGEVLVTFADAADTPASSPALAIPPAARPASEGRDGGVQAVERAPRRTGPVPATPATRRLARELGVDLREVQGSGPGGRVMDDDVRSAASLRTEERHPPDPAPAPILTAVSGRAEPSMAPRPLTPAGLEPPPLPRFEQWGPIERQPLSHLRRTIAERMTLAATLIPHVTHFDRADITELDAIITRNLESARARGVALTLTSFLLKAVALALQEHPQFNASLDSTAGEVIVKRYVHLGVAVATERGLIVPVLRDVNRKPLLELARELGALAARVREGKATLDDLRGGTFTITNIGSLGGTGAIPIINYPEVAILGVARGRLEPVVREGQIVPRMLLPLSLTFDHRVADGADGARLASAIIRRLERPEELLLDL
jgi:pyruvate dehydrogenase E2 component (dihydrolipoyllysine-residue acetyltransferase)